MNAELRKFLLTDNSRANTDFVGNFVRQKPEMIHELWKFYFQGEETEARRAAWIIDTVSEDMPELVPAYIPSLIDALPGFGHDGLKRHATRILSRYDIPEDKQGELIDICFTWLLSPVIAIAVKVHCMSILYKMSLIIPELRHELAETIEYQMPEAAPGFRSLGTKILKKLYRDMRN